MLNAVNGTKLRCVAGARTGCPKRKTERQELMYNSVSTMRVEKVTNNSRSLYVPKGEIRPTPKRGGLKLRAAKSS